MKNKILSKTALLSVLLITGLMLIESCKDSPLSAVEQTKAILISSGGWKMQTVTVDNTDKTSVYSGLAITFTETGFTATNGVPIWPVSGTWSFSDETGKNIKLGTGLEISIEEASKIKLVLKLNWDKTTLGPGRVTSVGGVNVFSFGK